MLQKTQATRALQEGCRRLGLPSSTATALLQFLSVKRVHDQFVDVKQLKMSPCATVEQLWQWMLLNTAVSTEVHKLLDGVVEHGGPEESDLSADSKLLQRLYALNILRLEGQQPDAMLWMEIGTTPGAMMPAQIAIVPPGWSSAALQRLHQGRLLISQGLPQQQQARLVQALQLLYADEATVTSDSNMHEAVARGQPAAQRQHPQPAAAAAAAGGGASAADGARAAKRTCIEPAIQMHPQQQQQQQQQQRRHQQQDEVQQPHHRHQVDDADHPFSITVTNQPGAMIIFKVKNCARLCAIMAAVEDHWSINVDDYKVTFLGENLADAIERDTTVGQLGMQHGDVLYLTLKQKGC